MLIRIPDDFSPEKITDCGQCFRAERLEDGSFRFIHRGNVLHIRKAAENCFQIDCDMGTWQKVWHPYFDLGRNYAAIRESVPSSDIFMKKAASFGAGIRILRQDPWEMLISFIISQRKSIPAIRQSIRLISEKWGSPVSTPCGDVFAFPTAEQLAAASEDDLRTCKVGYRAPYIICAVQAVLNHEPDLDALCSASYPCITEALMKVKGVGIKVANCTALFAYGRVSSVPIDTWIHKIIDEKYSGTDPFPAYGDVAGIMQQYAFFYALNHKDEL